MKKGTISTELIRLRDDIFIRRQERPPWMTPKAWGMLFLYQCKVALANEKGIK